MAQPPYRAGPKAREFEKKEVERMLRDGIIEPSQSNWAAPVVLVPKKEGTLRFCVDYRRLNSVTVRDSYPLPRMDESIDSLGEAKYFTTLDANAGYNQVKLAEKDRPKSAFVCHEGLYQYIRMPFGMTNAPATFQRTLDIVLSRFKWKSCLVYIDDIIIFSRNAEEHLRHVEEILITLRDAGVSLKIAKCEFFKDTVKYLGHVIKPGRLEVDALATKALKGMHHPRNQTELRSFLGLCNVYRRFVPNYSRIAAPLTELLKKDKPVTLEPFGEAESPAFQALIDAVCSPQVLALPRVGLKYSVDTDASNGQIGAALFQTHEDGERKPIGFWSRTLHAAERNYGVPEKEWLAVVWALTTLRPYLQGEKFTVHTDQSSLRWLMEITDPSGRLMRWRLRLSEFDFVVKYKKGLLNMQADALSRLPTDGVTQVEFDEEIPCYTVDEQIGEADEEEDFIESDYADGDELLAIHGAVPSVEMMQPITREELIQEQTADHYCQSILSELNRGKPLPFMEDDTGVLVRTVTRNAQMVVPEKLRLRVLYYGHYALLAGAPGGRKLYTTLRRDYYWPSLAIDCYRTVRNCAECARNRIKLRKNSSKMRLFPAKAPLESIAMDILGELIRTPRGNRYLLVMVDRYSKLVRTVPLKKITAYSVAHAFVHYWIFAYGVPIDVLSDNGGQFVSKFFGDVCRIVGTKLRFTTTYHPQANGQVERFNRTILAALRHYISDHPKDWDLFTDALTFAYNTQVHTSTDCTPFELVLARPPIHLSMEAKPDLPEAVNHAEYRERWRSRLSALMDTATVALRSTQQRYKRNFDRRMRLPKQDPLPGEYVFIRKDHRARHEPKHKLSPIATGPYRVIDADDKTLVVEMGQRHERVSRDRVEWAPPPPPDEPPPVAEEQPINSEPDTPQPADPMTNSPTSPVQPDQVGIEGNSSQNGEDGLYTPLQADSLQPQAATSNASGPPGEDSAGGVSNARNHQSHGTAVSPVQQGLTSPSARRKPKSKHLRREKAVRNRVRKRVSFRTPIVEQFIPPVAEIGTEREGEATPPSEDNILRRSPRLRTASTSAKAVKQPKRSRPRRAFPKPPAADIEVPTSYYDREYVIDRLVDHYYSADGRLLFQIRWFGYGPDGDTVQSIKDVPRSKVLAYCTRKRLQVPEEINQALPG